MKQFGAFTELTDIVFRVANGGQVELDSASVQTSGTQLLILPDLGAGSPSDTLVTLAATQTLTNKTISGASNTLTGVSLTAAVTGTLPVANGGTGTTTSTGSGNVVLATSPTFTSSATFGTNGTTSGDIAIANGGAGGASVSLQSLATTSAWNFNFPSSAGTSGQLLTSGGGGSSAMTWTTAGTGTVTSVSSSGGTTGLTLTTATPTTTPSLTLAGTLAVANGGSGATTSAGLQQAASPMTTLGDMEYENATPTPARLIGNITATKNFLTQTGTGSASAAPVWGTIAGTDVPLATATARGTITSYFPTIQSAVDVLSNASASATTTDGYLLYEVTITNSSNQTLTLAAASANTGRIALVKKLGGGTGTLTIQKAGSDSIDGASTYILTSQYDSVMLVSDGVSSWDVITEPVVVPGTQSGSVSKNGLPGNTTGNAVAAGYVGEQITATLAGISASPPTSGAYYDDSGTLTLTAGRWRIFLVVSVYGATPGAISGAAVPVIAAAIRQGSSVIASGIAAAGAVNGVAFLGSTTLVADVGIAGNTTYKCSAIWSPNTGSPTLGTLSTTPGDNSSNSFYAVRIA